MKKTTSFILVLAVLISCTSAIFADSTYTDMNLCSRQDAARVLTGLKIINGTSANTLSPKSNLTRAEMATIIVRALGYEDIGNIHSNTPFKDVEYNSWASGYIALANQLGLVLGCGDNTFRPNDNITYQEIITILVRMIGIKDNALDGTWPMNYILQARALKMIGDVKYDNSFATREETMQLIYNCLEIPMGKTDKNGNFTLYADGRTLLSIANTTTSGVLVDLNCARALGDMNLIGKYINKYVDIDTNKVNAFVVKSVELSGQVSGSAFISDKTYTFADDAFTPAAAVYVNGVVNTTTSNILGISGASILNVELEDDIITKVYSCEKWIKTATVQVATTDALTTTSTAFKGYNFIMTNKAIDESVLELNGVKSISEITVNDVIDIYAANGVITRMDVCANVVCGSPVKFANSKYTINNIEYKSNITLTLGAKYNCYLGTDGTIEFAKIVESAPTTYTTIYGFYIAQNSTSSWGETTTQYRIANVNGSIDTFTVPTPSALNTTTLYQWTILDNKVISVSALATHTNLTYSGIGVYSDNLVARVADDCIIIAISSTGAYSFTSLDKLEKNVNLAPASGSVILLNDSYRVKLMTVSLDKTHGNETASYAIINSTSHVYLNKKVITAFNGFIDGKIVTDYAIDIDNWYVSNGAYKLVSNADQIVSMTPITSDCAMVVTEVISNYILWNPSNYVVLDDNALVYYVTNGAFSISKVNDITSGASVQLFHTNTDELYDIVIWSK